MIESNSVEVGSGELVTHAATGPSLVIPSTAVRSFAARRKGLRALGMTLVVALALTARTWGLGASGFSEDEINKLHAAEAYSHFDFSANAEHPMLMKLGVWASMTEARWWNAHPALAAVTTVSPEAALRFPNALAGTMATAVVFLLAEAFFGTTIGFWAALMWALDANATAINRIGKEDTFLLFFLLLAAYLYERGKALAAADAVRRDRWYAASGASFGLMLASKYMPHYFGMHVLFNIAADRPARHSGPDKRRSFYAAMGGLFLASNFTLLRRSTWRYLVMYVQGDTLRHSGYNFAHHIYVNTLGTTPWGLPLTFYAVYFLTKVPLVVLAAACVGGMWAARHQADRGATFLRVFFVFTLLPLSLFSSKFLRYTLPVLAVVDIAAAIGIVSLLRELDTIGGRTTRALAVGAVTLPAIVLPLSQQISSAPYYGLAQNALGARLAPRGSLFPDDEFYDAGVREAVQAIAGAAAPGAVICSDATAVVSEYLVRSGRSDMGSCSIAHDGLPMRRVDTWVVAQEAHTYLENSGVLDLLRQRGPPWREINVGGVIAAQVFHAQAPPPEAIVRAEPR